MRRLNRSVDLNLIIIKVKTGSAVEPLVEKSLHILHPTVFKQSSHVSISPSCFQVVMMLIPLLLHVAPLIKNAVATGCFLVLASLLWSIGKTFIRGQTTLQRLHRIPCHRCTFFTDDYRLKCTVHPHKALSEEAIDCLDYELAVKRSSNDSIYDGGRCSRDGSATMK